MASKVVGGKVGNDEAPSQFNSTVFSPELWQEVSHAVAIKKPKTSTLFISFQF
jgi:hypothetical protein